jgi:hypothetical protein
MHIFHIHIHIFIAPPPFPNFPVLFVFLLRSYEKVFAPIAAIIYPQVESWSLRFCRGQGFLFWSSFFGSGLSIIFPSYKEYHSQVFRKLVKIILTWLSRC